MSDTDGAAVREEAAGMDPLEGVVARVGAVAVAWFRREPAGRCRIRHPGVLDDPHAGAVFDLDGDAGGLAGISLAT